MDLSQKMVDTAVAVCAAALRAASSAGTYVRKWKLPSLIVLGLAGSAAAVFIWAPWARPPDPTTQQPEQIAAYVASERFARLPSTRKKQYLNRARQVADWRRFRRIDLTDEQRQQLRRNVAPVMQEMMQERIDEYFKLPPEQRQAQLDEVIDAMRNRPRPQARSRPTSRPRNAAAGAGGRRWRGFSPQRLKNRLENTPPEVRARREQYFRDLRQRMRQRGITPGRRRGR